MRYILYWSLALSLVILSSAFDIFQGLPLGRACFPVKNFPACKRPLRNIRRSYRPSKYVLNTPDTKLYLFTPTSPDEAEPLHECGGGLPPNSTFDPQLPTELYTQGFLDGVCRSAWARELKNQAVKRGVNAILVDWTWGNGPDILSCLPNGKAAGQQVAFALRKIARQTGYDCRKYHFSANSFGVIVATFAGRSMKRWPCKMGRITALDASHVLVGNGKDQLNRNDALFVDAIHTNNGTCFPLGFGNWNQLGDIDFYVNNAVLQTSCVPYILQSYLKLDLMYATESLYPVVCSHLQSIQYYKISIDAIHYDNEQFIGIKCDSLDAFLSGECQRNCVDGTFNCMVMGIDTPLYMNLEDVKKKRRVYYVPAKTQCPYIDHTNFTGLPLRQINPA